MSTMPPAPPSITPAPEPPPRRRSRIPAAAAIIVGLAVVVGIVAIAQRPGERATATPTPTTPTPSEAPPLSPVADVEARRGSGQVALRWTAPTVLPEGAKYQVRRDDAFLGYVDPPARRFLDDEVVPGRTYRYEVRVEAVDGTFSEPAAATVKIPLPPLVEARLQGTFDVKTRFTSKTGYGEYDAPGFGWRFRPACEEGPCRVSLDDVLIEDLHLQLNRSGGTYRGSYTGKFGLACGNTDINSSVTFELRVARARVIDDRWRVTRLTGTLTQREFSQLGCGSSSATLSVTATLYR